MLLAHSASLVFRSISPPLIFLRVIWPRKLAWILAAAALASGSSKGMSRMSSSSFVQAPSCQRQREGYGWWHPKKGISPPSQFNPLNKVLN